jgi:hypothetical protein
MGVTGMNGVLTITLDGVVLLAGVPVPNHKPGTTCTWGLGASTGQAAGDEILLVRNVNLMTCVL